jgi:cystathionine gamma-synthase
MRPATIIAQGLGWVDETTRAIIPPAHFATTYIRDPDNQYRSGRGYGRADNPGYDQPEAVLAALEGGVAAMLFSSGMAAATAVFLTLPPDSHVVAPRVMYWGLRKWLQEAPLRVDFVEADQQGALEAAIRPAETRVVWIETPANPTWVVTDIAAAAETAHRAGAILAVDNTVPTPLLSRPIELGADIVMHSATKYLNGHSDVVAGALVSARKDALWEKLRAVRVGHGAILGAFEAWLLLRGMRTLALRVERACRSAQRIAEHFANHAGATEVLYPGLPDSFGHRIALRQMKGGFGGMLSIRVPDAVGVAARVKIWKRATSLGGVESLIEHRASIEGPDSPAPPDLLRLSVGIEDPTDLIDDLERAFA